MQHKARGYVTSLLAILAIGGTGSAYADDVLIGFSAPMTGPQAHYGRDFQNGVILAVEEFNASKPVVDGKPLRIVLSSQDDQGDPRMATTVAQKLVDSGIQGMLGPFNSGTTIPASRIFAQAGIPEVAMATAAEYTRQGFKTAFRMMTSDTQQGSVMGHFAVTQLHYKRIAIVDDRTAYGQGLADEFEKAAKSAGAKIIDREFASDRSLDFKAILTKLKSVHPDAIYYGGADAQAAPMVKQMRSLGMKAVLIAGEMVKTETFLKLAGPAAEGSVASLAGLPLTEMPGGNDYIARYKKRFGTDVDLYSPYGYDGAMSMFKAMTKANSTDPAKYLPALADSHLPGVTSSDIAYDARGDLKHGGITVYKVVAGVWTPVKSIEAQGS
ncbi:MAG: branched-chain amino acid ABC transporter substrate-binding protein [Janthinobacterium lividum]